MSTKKQTKYRPTLTADQITHIINLCKSESPLSNTSMAIMGVLAPFKAKIDLNTITPAYTTSPRETLEESLGLTLTNEEQEALYKEITMPPEWPDSIDKEAFWLHCYNKYKDSPDTCTEEEKHGAYEHMYLNDLMTPEQIKNFEAFGTL